jgi:hypothetical protein
MVRRETVDPSRFNPSAVLPYSLRAEDFQIAMQDVYDFFFDVNNFLIGKDLPRLDDMVRRANMSGLISEMLTASVAKHSRSLVQNQYHNGHPDLLVRGEHANDACKAGEAGVEIKTTSKRGGAVDTHGARNQWLCVFVYEVDETTQPARERRPLRFTELYLAEVRVEDFRRNERGALGTRTATLDRDGVKKLRSHWVYRLDAA